MIYYIKNKQISKNVLNYKKRKGFTLVELIIVITILAILSTIAFVAFQGYIKDSRDAKRVAEIKTIEDGLELYTITSDTPGYPKPDRPITYLLGDDSTVLSVKGVIGEKVAKAIKLNTLPKDSKTKDLYVYATTNDGKKYQVASIQESDILNAYIPFVSPTYAQGNLKAIVRGNYTPSFIQTSDGKEYFVPSLIWRDDNLLESEYIIDGNDNSKSIDLSKIINTEDNKSIVNEKIFYVMDNDTNLPYGTQNEYRKNFQLQYIQKLQEELNKGKDENDKYNDNDFQSLFDGTFEKEGGEGKNKEIYDHIGESIGVKMNACSDGTPHNGIKDFWNVDHIEYVNENSKCPDPVEFICKNGVWKNDTGGTEIKEDYKYADCFVGTPQNCEVGVEKSGYMLGEKLNHLGETTLTKTDGNFLNGTAQLKQEFVCFNGELQEKEGEDEVLEILTCDEGYYKNTDTCTLQWSGDGTSGNPYIFRDTNGNQQYPLSCKDLLDKSTWKNTLTGSSWNGNKFKDGVYFIKPDSGSAFEVYCDMTTDSGGWTLVFGNNNPTSIIEYAPINGYTSIINNNNEYIMINNLTCDGARTGSKISGVKGITHSQIRLKEIQWEGLGVTQTGDYCKGGGNNDGIILGATNLGNTKITNTYSQNISNLSFGCACVAPNYQRGRITQGEIFVR